MLNVQLNIQHSAFRISHLAFRILSGPRRQEAPIKYLCLVYYDETSVDALPGHERAAFVDEILAYRADLRAGGRNIASHVLQPADAATTVRVRHGRVSITDGPFGKAQEQLCEFYLIDARDLNDVVRVASHMPPARLGCVEVWPVRADP